jgi:SAM-dependent methyltransferase
MSVESTSSSTSADPRSVAPPDAERARTTPYNAKAARGLAARICNDFLLAQAIDAARELGILDFLASGGELDLPDYCSRPEIGAEQGVVGNLLDLLNTAGVVSPGSTRGRYTRGAEFDSLYRDRGFIYWTTKACGDTLSRWAELAKMGTSGEAFASRNGAATARSSAMIGAYHVDNILNPLILQSDFRTICDLGCGAATRLIHVAQQRRDITARGIEVNARSVEVARGAIAASGLTRRIEVIQADVKNLDGASGVGAGVDLLVMCFMGHDLWPWECVTKIFTGFRRVFPECQRFLLADTVRGNALAWDEIPVFQLPFESVHSIQRQTIPSVSDWERLFDATGWQIQQLVQLGVPNSVVFEIAPR